MTTERLENLTSMMVERLGTRKHCKTRRESSRLGGSAPQQPLAALDPPFCRSPAGFFAESGASVGLIATSGELPRP